MFDLFILLEEIQKGIGSNCNIFVTPRHGGLLFQVDWLLSPEHQFIRWQYVISKSEMFSVPSEIIANYLITRASDEYKVRTMGELQVR